MIPNIFISSTIADLAYLRDGIREAIEDLKYRPVMSEYGEVGYLNATTAADSCYRTVPQCQLIILIIGKRYGYVEKDGLSVTHKEYRAAKENSIPTITFVDPEVLHLRGHYERVPNSDFWDDLPQWDNPEGTFALLREISDAFTFNAILPIHSASDAKDKLKSQIADFVGQRLSETIAPMSNQIKDILAEIKTLRSQLPQGVDSHAKQYLAVTRFLLNDSLADYRKLLEYMFGNVDIAVEKIWPLIGLPQVVECAGYTFSVVPDDQMTMNIKGPKAEAEMNADVGTESSRTIYGSFGMFGGYTIDEKKHLVISESYKVRFDKHQHALYARARSS